ncbi:uncharacterized protein LOC117178503 [Belonocnema kinseyi]|uniref:uncharacterized protein LOC117178503 n=1 Tax=Belonocnema kinseyi TaxID=2817044 RepID=UPI00143CD644|nr:uncharacterized protein LOC117178503 [Belonocnema kinseyi]
MTEITDGIDGDGFHLPHHAVIKENSLSSKLLVVFNGSAKTNTGLSLNDKLMVGPAIQSDIVSLILKFRLHNYVITADIEKMYRQILVRPEDRKYQRILWGDPNNIKTFELKMVMFGLASAPFLAISCLQQLAEDEGHRFPRASRVLTKDMYVDNLLSGASTIKGALEIRNEITELLKLEGFVLRQWGSNDSQILRDLDDENIIPNCQLDTCHSDKQESVKTLGTIWNAQNDFITYIVKPVAAKLIKSKRKILSEIAKIFYPLGLLEPIILYAKRIMQRLWQLKLDWNESVPNSLFTAWMEFFDQLPVINNVSVERKVLINDAISVQLHGFCDAGECRYGACIYLRLVDSTGNISPALFYAKSCVAPLKTVSLPRLELCGAQLLAKLIRQAIAITGISFEKVVLWSDSTITLHLIHTSPHLLKTFEANRVADI